MASACIPDGECWWLSPNLSHDDNDSECGADDLEYFHEAHFICGSKEYSHSHRWAKSREKALIHSGGMLRTASNAMAYGDCVSPLRQPDAANPHVQFDERGVETEAWRE